MSGLPAENLSVRFTSVRNNLTKGYSRRRGHALATVLAAVMGFAASIGFFALTACKSGAGAEVPSEMPAEVVRASAAGQPTSESAELTSEQKAAILSEVDEQVRSRAYAAGIDFKKWPDHVKKHQGAIDGAKTAAQLSRAINRALNEFGISHIDIMSPSMVQRRREVKFGGIGVQIEDTAEGILISGVRDGTPADKAGLVENDVIVEVDGRKPTPENRGIRGPIGEAVKITVKRARSGELEQFEIMRAEISTAPEPKLTPIGEDAAVLRLASFSEGYSMVKMRELATKAADYPYLVIDLRWNGGGAVSNLTHMLGLFLPNSTTVGTFINRAAAKRFEEKTEKDDAPEALTEITKFAASQSQLRTRTSRSPYGGQVAVLINGGSASASEIFAAGMRELRGAPLIGSSTAGAVLMSRYVKLDSGFEMKVPMSDYVTQGGLRLEGNPLNPDLAIRGQMNADPRKDKMVLAAIDMLRTNAQQGALKSEELEPAGQ